MSTFGGLWPPGRSLQLHVASAYLNVTTLVDQCMTMRTSRHVRITGEARATLKAQLTDRYAAGVSIRALAEETGRSYGFVHRVLNEAGVTLRPRGGPRRRRVTVSASS